MYRIRAKALAPDWWDCEVNNTRVRNHGYLWLPDGGRAPMNGDFIYLRSLATGVVHMWHYEEVEQAGEQTDG